MGLFAREHHLAYYREVLVGHQISVHVCELDRTDKALHGISYLVNRTVGEIANSFEFLSVNVDLGLRRPATLPSTVAATMDSSIAHIRALGFGAEHGILELRSAALFQPDTPTPGRPGEHCRTSTRAATQFRHSDE